MTQIEKIKAEIKRRMNIWKDCDSATKGVDGPYCTLKGILSFIESLEKEQEVDLEKEIDKFLKDTGTPYCWCNDEEQIEWCKIIARHFYKLGLNAKTDAPKIKGWVARDNDYERLFWYKYKPRRRELWDCFISKDSGNSFELDKKLFPNLKWEDEPIEVELEIHRV